ncbi:protein kinase domain-containing protein [Nonomuraea guangzhouensis]|uniref:Protein kinase domain-containing protein n=1 Tax=Nonomuraea guangzhouensis TaxID=1291555 RepID=A0ABW4G5U3_9ACTN|nr:hypothetical protein [Nonomuraea guangzhouensis]
MDLPQRVGPYTLVRKLGEGGMGFVYLVRDAASGPVALKMMRPELAAREEFRRRFGKEAEAARRVARFCTAPVLDAGIEDGTAYLVTEYVEGPDLSGVVTRRGPLTGSNLEALAVGVATFEGGMQLQLWAVFEGLPEDAEHVDVNLGPLGMIKNVALSSA